ncbi:hypothetical protein QWZ14_28840 [Paeniroseomonas aquatica]|uniref:DUF3035 domain-containing protein n=1 Tax=Paeniroseomonas aquatica TaxID=373043 RepID=A0ABT8AFS6_9PROT|nr:hypothetical protein [Paeniroseomonas aquatica]MDN3568406.1 hypothetical protein [Paeniroseomonas aquatica]
MPPVLRPLLLLASLAAIPACASLDPFHRDSAWRPGGSNEANLAAMMAEPRERVDGTAPARAGGQPAAAAIDRLRTDRVRPLPDSGIARIVTVPGGTAGGAN